MDLENLEITVCILGCLSSTLPFLLPTSCFVSHPSLFWTFFFSFHIFWLTSDRLGRCSRLSISLRIYSSAGGPGGGGCAPRVPGSLCMKPACGHRVPHPARIYLLHPVRSLSHRSSARSGPPSSSGACRCHSYQCSRLG